MSGRMQHERTCLRQLEVLTIKGLHQLVRDRLLLGFVIYIFTLQIVVSTWGMSMDLRSAKTLIYDADHTAMSREQFTQVAYGILFRGEGLLDLWRPVLMICANGLLFFGLALVRFRRQFG